MRGDAAFLAVTAATGAQQQRRDQADPSAHRMYHDGAGKIVERRTQGGFQPALDGVITVPGYALEEWIDETHQQESCRQLRIEFRTFGNPCSYITKYR